jgi:hypothetical protein
MMSLLEIELANINLDVAREAYDQATKRLADALDTKKAYEQKAFSLFSGYLTVSLALIGVGGAVYKDHGPRFEIAELAICGAFFVAGAICFVLALMDDVYGAPASSPDMWLNPGTIDGDATVLPRMLAYVTYYHQERIDTSTAANAKKAVRIRIGILLGVAAPIVLVVVFFLPIERWLDSLLH